MTGKRDPFCLMCDITVTDSFSVNIYTTVSQYNGEPLINLAAQMFRSAALEFHSVYLCLHCYKLFRMLDEAQYTVANIRCEILKVFGRNRKEKAVKQQQAKSQSKERDSKDFVGNFNEQDKAVTQMLVHKDDTVHEIKDTLSPKSISSIIIASQTLSQETTFSQDLSVQSINIVMGNDTTNVIRNISTKGKGIGCLNKKDVPRTIIKDSSVSQDDQEVNYHSTNVNVQTEVLASQKSREMSKHGVNSTEHLCITCGVKYNTQAGLNAHIKTHLALRTFMCEKCGRVYKHKNALEVHIGMHNGINPFQCSYCKKCFTQKGALIRHLPIHTGETPYQCELCGTRFIHHTSYNMHMLSHSGKKSHKCEICNKLLFSMSHLKRHMRVHTGEKPYSCYLCGRRFAERYNLLVHLKIHDPDGNKTRKEKRVMMEKRSDQDDLVILNEKQELDVQSKCQGNLDIFNIDVNAGGISDNFVPHFQTQDTDMKQTNYQDGANEETWLLSNSAKTYGADDSNRLLFSLPQLVTNPLVTLDQDFSGQNINCDVLQVNVASNAASFINGNHIVSMRI